MPEDAQIKDVTNGPVTISYRVTAPNYTTYSSSATLTIKPRAVTVTADDISKSYGEQDPDLTATIATLAEGDDESDISYTLSRETGENLGTYLITPAGTADQGNYSVTYVPGIFTITAPESASGEPCGTNVKWSVTGDTIIFSKGDEEEAPLWGASCVEKFRYDTKIKKAVIAEPMGIQDRTQMAEMFTECDYVEEMDLSKLVIPTDGDPISMEAMFKDCNQLRKLNLQGWDTSRVTSMDNMFSICESLKELNLGSNWNTSNVISMSNMFNDCISMTELDLSGWNVSNVTTMSAMFYYCENLKTLNLHGWNVSNVTLFDYMFEECSSLTTLDLSGWQINTIPYVSMDTMFSGCFSLKYLDLSSWDTAAASWFDFDMFTDCDELKTLTLGQNTLAQDIFTTLPDDLLSADWYYIKKDITGNTYNVGDTLPGTTLLSPSSYDYDTMGGTWSVNYVYAEDVHVTYDGQPHGIEVLVPGKDPTDYTIKYSTDGVTFDLTDNPEITDVSDSPLEVFYQVTVTGQEPVTGSATVTIDPVKISAVDVKRISAPVGGEPLGTNASISTNGVNLLSFGWSPETDADGNAKYRTSYTVTVQAEADENFIFTDTATAAVNGEPASAVITNDKTKMIIKYTFPATETRYVITWIDGDGKVLKTDVVSPDETPDYSGPTPTKTATTQYTYTFNNNWPSLTRHRDFIPSNFRMSMKGSLATIHIHMIAGSTAEPIPSKLKPSAFRITRQRKVIPSQAGPGQVRVKQRRL